MNANKKLSPDIARRVAVTADVDPRTVQAVVAGVPVRPSSRRRVLGALNELGMAAPDEVRGLQHQEVNLRAPTPRIVAGDAHTRELLEREHYEALEAMTVPFAVAPRAAVTTFDGRVLRPGDEVRDSDFDASAERPWQQIKKLVDAGLVLDRSHSTNGHAPTSPEAA